MRLVIVYNDKNALGYFRKAHLDKFIERGFELFTVRVDNLKVRELKKGDLFLIYGLATFLRVVMKIPIKLNYSKVFLLVSGLGFFSYMKLLDRITIAKWVIKKIVSHFTNHIFYLNLDDSKKLVDQNFTTLYSEGLSLDRFREVDRLNLDRGDITLIYSGRDHIQKRLENMNRWINFQANSVPEKEIVLHVLGDIPTSRIVAGQTNLRVIYHGRVENPLEYINSVDMGVMTSFDGEGMSFFMLETLLLGKKFISPPCPGVNDNFWHPMLYNMNTTSLVEAFEDEVSNELLACARLLLETKVDASKISSEIVDKLIQCIK